MAGRGVAGRPSALLDRPARTFRPCRRRAHLRRVGRELPLDSSGSCPVDGITPRQSNLSTAQAIKMGSWGVQRPGAGSKPKTLRKPSQPWDGHGTCPSVGERLTGVRSGDLVTGKHRLAAHPALLHSSEMRETQHLAAQAPGLRADNRGPVDLGDLEGRESHLAFRTSSRRGQAGT
jgi:hypothetical protein